MLVDAAVRNYTCSVTSVCTYSAYTYSVYTYGVCTCGIYEHMASTFLDSHADNQAFETPPTISPTCIINGATENARVAARTDLYSFDWNA